MDLTTPQTSTIEVKPKMSPKDFFLHLAAMVTLYISASSLLVLLFQIINTSFPDALESSGYYYYDPYSGAIRFAIASLVIIFPLYVCLTRMLNKDYTVNPEKRNLGIRKWLMYLTLFVAGAVMVGDLIFLLNTFLGGEVTTRFILKVLAVLVVSALIFGYYLRDLRSVSTLSLTERRMFRYGAFVVVLTSIIGGFVVMGSPVTQREIRFDNQRVSDLQNIQWQVVQYWQQKQKLPDNLGNLSDSIGGYVAPIDPENKKPYEYAKTGDLSFKLCANFGLASQNNQKGISSIPAPIGVMGGLENSTWTHPEGRTCFDRTIDPERYPPISKQRAL